MKRLFFAAILMLVIAAFVVMPAFAADACVADSALHQPTAASLILHVKHANEMGHIKNELMTALIAPLNIAANDSLPATARVGALQAFINQVNAQAGSGIDADCAQHLATQAQQTISALNGHA